MPDIQEYANRVRARLYAYRSLGFTLHNAPFEQSNRLTSFLILNTFNAWAEFCRNYYLAGVRGFTTHSGVAVSTSLANNTPIQVAMQHAKLILYPKWVPAPLARRDEPAWHSRKYFLKVCQGVKFTNYSQVSAALALKSTSYEDIWSYRNFYAHRNEDTALQALSIARRQKIIGAHPTTCASAIIPGAATNFVESWAYDLDLTVAMMMK